MRRDNAKVCSKLHSTPILPYHTTVHSPIPTHTILSIGDESQHLAIFLGFRIASQNVKISMSKTRNQSMTRKTYIHINRWWLFPFHTTHSYLCIRYYLLHVLILHSSISVNVCAVCVRARLCMQIIRADRIRWGWRSLTAVSTNKNNKRLKKTADHWQHSTMQIAAKCLLKSQLVVTVLFHNIHINFYHITNFKHLAFGNDFRIHNDIILYDI